MKYVAEIASRLNVFAPSTTWIDELDQRAVAYLEANPNRAGERYLKECRKCVRLARAAIKQEDAQGAAFAAMAALQAAWQAEIADGRVMLTRGVKHYRMAEAENRKKAEGADKKHQNWRAQADAIRKKSRRPRSKVEIAKQIDDQHWNTIRKFI